ncbi:MAG: hypothetical protein SGARI_002270 [Bacillariaceae sp.]
MADLAESSVPNSLKGVRACKRCGILKTLDQFIEIGCENCPFLDMVSRMFVLRLLEMTKMHVDILAVLYYG